MTLARPVTSRSASLPRLDQTRPRVGEVVSGPEMGGGDLCVDLCRAYRGVSQQLLDATDIGAVIEHVGRARMPQDVWA